MNIYEAIKTLKDYCEANIQNHEWRTILNHLNRIVKNNT